MSAFLEEYGKVIVVVVVIAALIILASYFKTKGSTAAQNSFNTFTNMAQTAADQAANEAAKE